MPTTTRIRAENDIFQTLAALRSNRVKRNKRKEFIFEGVRSINNALQFGWEIRSLLFAPERPLSDWARAVLSRCAHAQRYELSLPLLVRLSGRQNASELIVTATIPADDLARIPTTANPLILVFDRPASPGNLGTLIRSCDALGVDGVIVTGHAVDVYDQEAVNASTGSLFCLPVVRVPSHHELAPWLAARRNAHPGLQVIGADEQGATHVAATNFQAPTVLLVGNEARGLSGAYKALCDGMVRVPMQGSASSLNVACAGSIVLYEIHRQRFCVG